MTPSLARPDHVEEPAAEVDDPATVMGPSEVVDGPAGAGPAGDDLASDGPADDGPADDGSAGDGSARDPGHHHERRLESAERSGSSYVSKREVRLSPAVTQSPEKRTIPVTPSLARPDHVEEPAAEVDDPATVMGPSEVVDGPAGAGPAGDDLLFILCTEAETGYFGGRQAVKGEESQYRLTEALCLF